MNLSYLHSESLCIIIYIMILRPKKEKLKVHISYSKLWEFINTKKAIETAKKMCSVYDLSFIIDPLVQNWFSKFPSDDTS